MLKGSGTEKRGRERKILKSGGKLGQGVGALKEGGEGGGGWNPVVCDLCPEVLI